MRIILIVVFLLCIDTAFSQYQLINVNAASVAQKRDSVEQFKMTVENIADKPVCIMVSTLLRNEQNSVEYLTAYKNKKDTAIYAFWWAPFNDEADLELLNYKGIILLPNSNMEFLIEVKRALQNKVKRLEFEYCMIEEFCFPSFLEDQKKLLWYKNFKLHKASVLLREKE